VQLNHLALVPELTPYQHERVYLNSLRSCFTILSGVSVYVLVYLLLDQSATKSTSASGKQGLSSADEATFFMLSLVIVGIGSMFVVIFLLFVQQPKPRIQSESAKRFLWYHWFRSLAFYHTSIIYMCTRILVNVSQCYVPLFLLITIQGPKSSIATMPLIIFSVGFISTLLSEMLTRKLGSAGLTFAGCTAMICASTIIYHSETFNAFTYVIAVLLGIGSGVVGVSALSLISELVGERTDSSAFVYGSMSFVEKLGNGFAIFVVEYITPDAGTSKTIVLRRFYRDVMALIPGGAGILCIIFLFLLKGMHHIFS